MLSALGYGRGDDPDRNIHFAGQSTTLGCIPVHADAILPLLGGFSRHFSPAYYEDADYCLTVWQKGLRVISKTL
jgi:GT2 family glycosyltransferase